MEPNLNGVEKAVIELLVSEECSYPDAAANYCTFRDGYKQDDMDDEPVSALRQYAGDNPGFILAEITVDGLRTVIEAVEVMNGKWPGFTGYMLSAHVQPYKDGVWNLCNILGLNDSMQRLRSDDAPKRNNSQYWALRYPHITMGYNFSQYQVCEALASFAGNWPFAHDAEVIEIVLAGI